MLETLRARKEQLEAQGKKGFTLMEMLIVIAIIAVLIAIAIPVFTSQLDSADKATTEANGRSIYAMLTADYMDDQKYQDDAPADNTTIEKASSKSIYGQNIETKGKYSIEIHRPDGKAPWVIVKDGTTDVATFGTASSS